jgi:hypothetical protein
VRQARLPRIVVRLTTALVAVLLAFAPGVASIIDARPAAVAMSETATTHAESPGSPHAIAHQDKCALCGLATHQVAEASPRAFVPDAAGATWPPRATWDARRSAADLALTRSRAPPV